MGISPATIEAHIAKWTAHYGPLPQSRWPARLFRHEALENAVPILRAGELKSRNHAAETLIRDVAPGEIIGTNARAHGYARLYFRPRTPTQWHIEGIRQPGECRFPGKHAPVLYMFVFKSRDVLTRDDVRFSNGNMQVNSTDILDGDRNFGDMNFSKIYHVGSFDPTNPANSDITVWRCAEVLSASPLLLDDALEAVVCRSHAERRLLLHELGQDADRWAEKIRILTKPGYFNAEYAFVESVDLQGDGVHVRFHPRRHLPMESSVRLTIRSLDDLAALKGFPLQPLDLRSSWRFPYEPASGRYEIEIEMEGELAYRAISSFNPDPF